MGLDIGENNDESINDNGFCGGCGGTNAILKKNDYKWIKNKDRAPLCKFYLYHYFPYSWLYSQEHYGQNELKIKVQREPY